MRPARPAPQLWLDWCAATGTAIQLRDETTLARFARQAQPSRNILRQLQIRPEVDPAPAWPRGHQQEKATLETLLTNISWQAAHPDTHWVTRLQLRRLGFVAVLLAPPVIGGAGLSRRRCLALNPGELDVIRQRLAVAENVAGCSRCAVWAWLEILGTNAMFARGSVQAVVNRRRELKVEHPHTTADPTPAWREASTVLPRIDRWGSIEDYDSMHPSSLSVLTRALDTLLELEDPGPMPDIEPEPKRSVRQIDEAEQQEIFDRADAVLARVRSILRELDV